MIEELIREEMRIKAVEKKMHRWRSFDKEGLGTRGK